MGVEVLIRRKFEAKNADGLAPIIVKLRSLATMQPGYISGETLKCIDPSGENEYLVRSTWDTLENWKTWLKSNQRIALQDQIDRITKEKTEYRVYEPLIGGFIGKLTID